MKIHLSKLKIISAVAFAILPFYFLIAFSAVICQFHHSEESSHHSHASSGNAKHNHSFGDKGNLCKFFHDISQTALTNPALSVNPPEVPAKIHDYSIDPVFTGNGSTQYLRGPPVVA